MNKQDIIEGLRQEAATNSVSKAVLIMFALRQRARKNVTLHALQGRMKAEGFMYGKQQYEPVLKRMAQLGLGTLKKNPKGQIVALVDLQTTLKSIGEAACGNGEALSRFHQKNTFTALRVMPPAIQSPAPAVVTQTERATKTKADITVMFRGRPISMALPEGLSNEDLGSFLNKFRKLADGGDK